MPEKYFSQTKQEIKPIPSKAYKVMDAPGIQDDFYLNILDWSQFNDNIAIGVNEKVYAWSNIKSKISRICSYDNLYSSYNNSNRPNHFPYVCSVTWNPVNDSIAVGRSDGISDIWDSTTGQLIRSFSGHYNRVNATSWNNGILSPNVFVTGSKDSNILLRDLRVKEDFISEQKEHLHEICGLKFSPDGGLIASGANDNLLLVWDVKKLATNKFFLGGFIGLGNSFSSNSNSRNSSNISSNLALLCKITDHTAAVKALDWCPYQRNVLASGGGTNDQTIKIWNVNTSSMIWSHHTGSQVCNMRFSKTSKELVSTHGYSQNQIILWNASDLKNLTSMNVLTGHSNRVLYLSMSPATGSIVTAAGDETVRFWNTFPKLENKKNMFDISNAIM